MRCLLIALAALAAAGCGTTRTVTEVQTVTTTAAASQSSGAGATLQPADPSMPAECQPQPNQPPTCTQGSYQVALPLLGSSCGPSGDVWEWNEQFQGVGGGPYTAVCAKRDPSHLPSG